MSIMSYYVPSNSQALIQPGVLNLELKRSKGFGPARRTRFVAGLRTMWQGLTEAIIGGIITYYLLLKECETCVVTMWQLLKLT